MFRKHFRFRRMVIGLAFAGLALPAQAFGSTGIFADGGPMPVSVTTPSTQQSFLRYHEVGYPVGAGPVILAEQSTITPLEADGLRWTKLAEHYQALQATQSAAAVSTSNGFDWTEAGIAASSAFGAALLLGLGIAITRRQRTRLTHA